MLGPGPPIVDPPSKKEKSEKEKPSTSSNKSKHDNTQEGSTILRIPKVSMPSTASTPVTSSVPTMPTTLRVRKDLMFLGLMANPPATTTPPAPSPKGKQQPE